MTTPAQQDASAAVEAAVEQLNSALRIAGRAGVLVRLDTTEMQEFGKEPLKLVTATCLVEVKK